MRNSLNDRHNFDKEVYSKMYTNKPSSRQYDRNPIVSEEEPRRQYYEDPDPISQPKRKNRMLAKGDFSEKHQGTFALNYDNFEEFRPTKKCFSRQEDDPIKPPEIIPPSNFKRPDRNPIVNGDCYREPELRVRPDQISNVFNTEPVNSYQERRNYM